MHRKKRISKIFADVATINALRHVSILLLVCSLIIPAMGTDIPSEEAITIEVPEVDGNGVYIELYNRIGGGRAPRESDFSGRAFDGTTLSPVVDFPSPGSTIRIGNSFNQFFQNTTIPPEQVSGLAASNFIMRIVANIKITRELDEDPGTPEIELSLDVGSDDGYQLKIGSQILGTAGDRPFRWSNHPLSFVEEGLYPMELLFAANSVGYSGLELAWNHGGVASRVIVPQTHLYHSEVGDRLITFEEVANGTEVADQFSALGVKFSVESGLIQATNAQPTQFVPISGTQVLADPREVPNQAGIVEAVFVGPDGMTPATTNFVSFFIIDAELTGAKVQAFDLEGIEIFSQEYRGGGRTQTEVKIESDFIAQVRIDLGGAEGTDTAAVDNFAFRAPILVNVFADTEAISGNRVSGTGVFAKGSLVRLSAEPAPNFLEWTEGGEIVSMENPYEFVARESRDLTAIFLKQAAIVLSNLDRVYDGQPQPVTVVSSPAGLEVEVRYNGLLEIPTEVGDYQVEARTTGRYYSGQVSSLLRIRKNQTITFPALAVGPSMIPLEATVSSGMPVDYQADPSRVATVETVEGMASLLVAQGGSMTVTATQAGNQEYWPVSASQTLRLPPLIRDFTVDGVEITDSTVISRPLPVLAVAARDVSGISQAEFFGRVPGASTWELIGLDSQPGDGLSVDFPAADLPEGPYEFRVVTTAGGGFAAERIARVTLAPLPVLAITLGESLVEGGSLSGMVSVSVAPATGLMVTLQSSRPGQVNAGPPVLVPAGSTSAPFTIRGVQDIVMEDLLGVRITASAAGALSANAIVNVIDDDLPILTLTIDRPGVSESAGATAAYARVVRDVITALPLTVTLENSDPGAAIVPATVTIPGGKASADFAIGVVDDDLVDGSQTSVLRALAKLENGTVVSESQPVSFEVGDDEGPSLTLGFSQEYLLEGTTGSITLTRNEAPITDPLAVVIGVDLNEELSAPTSFEIPAGAASTTFEVSALDDGAPDGSKPVILTATAVGYGSGQLSLTVTDETLPDLIPVLTAIPEIAPSESEFQISYRLENRGAAATVSPSLQRVFLSSDPVLGDDVLLTQFNFTANLDPGVGFSRTATVRAPRESGSYWIFVVADAVESIAEISESNNAAFSATPLEVLPEYSATVSTMVEEIPANHPIPLTGRATLASGGPAPHRLVNIHIRLGETERIIAAITGVDGQFSTTWNPLPGEGGRYEIGATHPGIPTAPTQDAFTILTLNTEFPEDTIAFDEGSSATFNATFTNPNSSPFTGLTFSVPDLPEGLDFDFTLPATGLAPGEVLQVGVAVSAAAGYSGDSSFLVTLMSDQGLTLRIPVEVVVRPLLPRLVVTPDALACSVLRDGQKVATFSIENVGSLASGPIEMLLPDIPWLTSISPGVLPSISPGSKVDVSLLLAPDDSVPLTRFDGNFILRPQEGSAVNIPFAFRIVSDLKGDLEISVVDEYHYFTEEAPLVKGASVVVRDAISAEEIVRAETGEDGMVGFTDLAEGWYTIEVDSPDHSRFRGNFFADAGELNREQIFITRELVRYNWTVEEIEIEDRYRISVESTFETNVPAPVVTVTPASFDLADLTVLGQTKLVYLSVENHGFIAAEGAEFYFGSHPFYEITPLIGTLGHLAAKTSVTVPVTITRVGEFAEDGTIRTRSKKKRASIGDKTQPRYKSNRALVPCSISAGLKSFYKCGEEDVQKTASIAVSGVQGNCPRGGGGRVDGGGGGGGGGGGAPLTRALSFTSSTPCDCLFFDNLCFLASKKIKLDSIAEKLAGAMSKALPPWLEVKDVEISVGADGELCVCCEEGDYGVSGKGSASASIAATVVVGFDSSFDPDDVSLGDWSGISVSASATAGAKTSFTGELKLEVDKECNEDGSICLSGSAQLEAFAGLQVKGEASATYHVPNTNIKVGYEGTAESTIGISGFAKVELKGCLEGDVTIEACASLTPQLTPFKLELSAVNDTRDDIEPFQTIEVGVQDLPTFTFGNCGAKTLSNGISQKDGSPESVFVYDSSEFFNSDAYLISQEFPDLVSTGGVCSTVRIRIDQDAVMTRSAFRANLELENNQDDAELKMVDFDFNIRDLDGQPADDVFNIRVTDFSGLDAIDGSGTIAALSSGRVEWTLIPRDSAAPLTDTEYTIGGTITYDQAGTVFSIPVEAVAITVRPDAALYLKYFHQRDVFSDDPHTDPTEPSIPYALAVLVENRGAGVARDLTITSAKPKIVDNEKGLLINFETIATEVAGQGLSPSLTANFGAIGAGERKVGTWLMTSTLQGLFIDYEATFEHLDGFGDPRLSLIKEVEIHEMNHLIEALGDKVDGAPDFLVNDIADPDDLPDTIHFSDGGTAPVAFDDSATVDSVPTVENPTITLTTGGSTGWTYLRIPDPADGKFLLVSAVRSDGLVIPVDRNIWTTDRTFIGLGRRPIYENILHLADCDSTGSYTLTYVPAPDADLLAPTSEIVMLPEQSGTAIPVSWQGVDEGGIAGYDIYVMIGDGPWMPWLINTRRTSGIYEGVLGESYRFYSRATDLAGNRQSGDPAAQASTAVSLNNAPPVVAAIGDLNVAEGATFQLTVVAADPDGPDSSLRYSVVTGPSGLVIGEKDGKIRWVTGENNGGLTEEVVIRVKDAGIPEAQSELTFSVHVLEINSPPVLASLDPAVLEPGESMIRRAIAIDPDFPSQSVGYSLAEPVPAGMAVDPESGIITYTPTDEQAGQSYGVSVIASDNGDPIATSETILSVRVLDSSEVVAELPVWAPVSPQVWFADTVSEVSLLATVTDGSAVLIGLGDGTLPNGISLINPEGDGSGALRWDTAGIAPGIYQIPLLASSEGGITELSIPVRIVPRDFYWEWLVAEVAGKEIDLSKLGIRDDLDGDGRPNGFEMALFKNPSMADSLEFDCLVDNRIDGKFLVLDLCFYRRKGSEAYVVIDPEYSDILGGDGWQQWDWDWQAEIDPRGDEDGDPATEYVTLQVISPLIGPDVIDKRFYRLGLRFRPGIGE